MKNNSTASLGRLFFHLAPTQFSLHGSSPGPALPRRLGCSANLPAPRHGEQPRATRFSQLQASRCPSAEPRDTLAPSDRPGSLLPLHPRPKSQEHLALQAQLHRQQEPGHLCPSPPLPGCSDTVNGGGPYKPLVRAALQYQEQAEFVPGMGLSQLFALHLALKVLSLFTEKNNNISEQISHLAAAQRPAPAPPTASRPETCRDRRLRWC